MEMIRRDQKTCFSGLICVLYHNYSDKKAENIVFHRQERPERQDSLCLSAPGTLFFVCLCDKIQTPLRKSDTERAVIIDQYGYIRKEAERFADSFFGPGRFTAWAPGRHCGDLSFFPADDDEIKLCTGAGGAGRGWLP